MKNLIAVTKFTFLEVYRSKVMISLIFLAVGLVLLTYIASEFAYGDPAKVALDVGMGVMSITNLIMAIFIGATLLSKEIEQRTLYMIISRPISRSSFLIGKILGLSSVLFLNSLILGFLSVALHIKYEGTYQPLFVWAMLFSFLEAFIVLIFSVFFSLITNTTLSVVYTIIVFIVGHALNETAKILLFKVSPVLDALVEVAFFLVPNFYKLNLKDFLLYQQDISINYLLNTLVYVALYLAALFLGTTIIFKNKNLD